MRQIILGYGEVGKALHAIFPEAEVWDPEHPEASKEWKYKDPFDVMHVCFPCKDKAEFEGHVAYYKAQFEQPLVIVHSSVPVGTCDRYGWVHSPIRGVHPNLEAGIRTFVKFFGGERAADAAQYFAEKGIKVRITEKAANTEALKLWDTTQYGILILLEKEIKKYCEEHHLDFELVYRYANMTYNEGYIALGMPHVIRPALMHKEGKIGGHCVVENAHLLDSPSARRIIEDNSRL